MTLNAKGERPPEEVTWYMTGWIPLAFVGTVERLQALTDYRDLVEKGIQAEKKRFDQKGVEATKNLSQQDADAYFEAHESEYHNLEGGYKMMARASVLMLACSRLESAFIDLARDLYEEPLASTPTPLSDCKGTGVSKASVFFKANFDLEMTRSKHWQWIQAIFKVRDCAVHASGDLTLMKESQKPPIHAAVGRFPGLTLTADSRLDLSPAFLNEVIKLMSDFWWEFEASCRLNPKLGPVYWSK